MNRGLLCFSLLVTLSLSVAACGDGDATTSTSGSGGSGAQGGNGGSGAQGGNGGSGAQGGNGGSGAQGGNGGSGGQGAQGGQGGSGGQGGQGGSSATAQCTDDAQCTLVNDCCSCVGIGPGEQPPPCDINQCLIPTCQSQKLPGAAAQCQAGQCVAGFDCDHKQVLCEALPPECPPGETPSVGGSCWGPCVKATECATVAGCDQCGAGQACVRWETQLGPQIHCVELPSSCNGKASCECMGAAVCTGSFDLCSVDGQGAISCACPQC